MYIKMFVFVNIRFSVSKFLLAFPHWRVTGCDVNKFSRRVWACVIKFKTFAITVPRMALACQKDSYLKTVNYIFIVIFWRLKCSLKLFSVSTYRVWLKSDKTTGQSQNIGLRAVQLTGCWDRRPARPRLLGAVGSERDRPKHVSRCQRHL